MPQLALSWRWLKYCSASQRWCIFRSCSLSTCEDICFLRWIDYFSKKNFEVFKVLKDRKVITTDSRKQDSRTATYRTQKSGTNDVLRRAKKNWIFDFSTSLDLRPEQYHLSITVLFSWNCVNASGRANNHRNVDVSLGSSVWQWRPCPHCFPGWSVCNTVSSTWGVDKEFLPLAETPIATWC